MASLYSLLWRTAIVLFILFLLDLYAYQAIRTLTAGLSSARLRTGLRWAYWITSGGYLLTVAVSMVFLLAQRNVTGNHFGQLLFGVGLMLYLPKLIIIVFLLGEDFVRMFRWVIGKVYDVYVSFRSSGSAEPVADRTDVLTRSEFLSKSALVLAAVPFVGIAHGILRGRYAYTVHKHTLTFPNLPAAFDGFKLVQLSDIHSGSFDNQPAVAKGVELAMQQGADVILFTGDIVNNSADEYEPWVETFKQLSAPMGMYSTLGNHDYGDYVKWPSAEDKKANLERLKQLQADTGFRMLHNENVVLEKNGEKIALVGVENWGKPPFPQYGDLDRAVKGAEDVPFKILMSHDPSHWDAQVLSHAGKFDLTLSGHTHGMQFGIEIPGIRWSPVKWRYPRWAGLYQEGAQYLYVNRGFGFLGLPARVGIWPEITVIELKRA